MGHIYYFRRADVAFVSHAKHIGVPVGDWRNKSSILIPDMVIGMLMRNVIIYILNIKMKQELIHILYITREQDFWGRIE